MGPAFTGIQQDLYEIGRDGDSWTVFYPLGELAPVPGVVLRRLDGVVVPVDLITRPGSPARQLLTAAAANAPLTNRDVLHGLQR